MYSEFEVRPYESGDERDILKLFKIVFKRDMTINFWRWRFIEGPFGKGIIYLAFDGDILTGHYAVFPTLIKIKREIVKAVFSMTTMTHPNYRGKGIFTTLANAVYEEAYRKGYKLVFGFPNENSFGAFVNKLGWKGFGRINLYVLSFNLTKFHRLEGNLRCKIKQVYSFDDNINKLWESVKDELRISVPRISRYLNWRFVENPEEKYFLFLVNTSDHLEGYFVLKKYTNPNNGEKYGHIIDFLFEDYSYFENVLFYSYNFFKETGVSKVTFWINESIANNLQLAKLGVKKMEMERTYFGYKIFDLQSDFGNELENMENWYITMGDSDVF